MFDIITTLIGAIPSTVTAVSVYKAVKPFLDKVIGPGAEELGEAGRDYIKGVRTRNAEKTISKASKMLDAVGAEPASVPLRVLAPLLENASLEDDDFLSNAWAALLANAANSKRQVDVEPSFCEILKQLSVVQARILRKVYEHTVPDIPRSEWLRKGVAKSKIMSEFMLSEDQYDVATDNLYRLQLCGNSTDDQAGKLTMTFKGAVCLLGFGYAFVTACTPPKVENE
jgi:hypothetical protein